MDSWNFISKYSYILINKIKVNHHKFISNQLKNSHIYFTNEFMNNTNNNNIVTTK